MLRPGAGESHKQPAPFFKNNARMEKQFILVALMKEACLPIYLEPLLREKACFPVRVQWMVFCENRQVYNILVSASKVCVLKSILDETNIYESLELFEYVSW